MSKINLNPPYNASNDIECKYCFILINRLKNFDPQMIDYCPECQDSGVMVIPFSEIL